MRKGRHIAFDLASIAHIDGANLHANRRRQRLDGAEHSETDCGRGLAKHRYPPQTGRDLLE